MRLALEMGRLDPDRMIRGLPDGRLTARQLNEWIAYFALEPFGPLQMAQYFGQLTASIINGNPFRRKRGVLKAHDVYPWLKADKELPSAEQLRFKLECLLGTGK